jgi:type IV pilus assembly protein PilO
VASLPRVVILTMHDVALKPIDKAGDQLMLEGTVRTYHTIEDIAAPAKKPGAPTGAQGSK